jgi:hypothetical protein
MFDEARHFLLRQVALTSPALVPRLSLLKDTFEELDGVIKRVKFSAPAVNSLLR